MSLFADDFSDGVLGMRWELAEAVPSGVAPSTVLREENQTLHLSVAPNRANTETGIVSRAYYDLTDSAASIEVRQVFATSTDVALTFGVTFDEHNC